MMQARARLAAVVALMAATTYTLGAVAPASGDDGRKVVFQEATPVTEANFTQAFVGDVSRCSFTPDFQIAAPCVTPTTATAGFDATVTGDLQGLRHSGDSGVLGVFVEASVAKVDIPFVSFNKFIGDVAGCGTGSYIFESDGNLGSPVSRWKIVANSGRGGLAGISGSGTAVTTRDGVGGTTISRATGRIRCGHRTDD